MNERKTHLLSQPEDEKIQKNRELFAHIAQKIQEDNLSRQFFWTESKVGIPDDHSEQDGQSLHFLSTINTYAAEHKVMFTSIDDVRHHLTSIGFHNGRQSVVGSTLYLIYERSLLK